MPQDAFHIRRSAAELDVLLKGGKVNRISQADKDELTFTIYTGKSTVKLVLSTNASNARVCLSRTEKEPAPVAPNFCMLLRKHLLGAEILSVSQYRFERIVEIAFHCVTDFSQTDRLLRCELMGKYSNLILTENDVILGALKTTALEDSSRRVLLAGAKYAYPPAQDKLSPFDREGLKERLTAFFAFRSDCSDGVDGRGIEYEATAKFLFENVAGLALPTAREIVGRYLKIGNDKQLWEYIGEFCETCPNEPYLIYQGGKATDFSAFLPSDESLRIVKMPSLNRAEDEFYSARENKRAFEDKKRRLEAAVRALKKKQAKKYQDTCDRLREAENLEENRIKGELITANLYRLGKGMKSCELENWYDPSGKSVKIALDETLSPSRNAQRYFKIYQKQKRTLDALLPRKEEEEREMEYTASVFSSIAVAETIDDLKETEEELIGLGLIKPPSERAGGKKKNAAKTFTPFREYSFGGFRIFGGRNNLQNDRLLRGCAAEDIWLHTQKYHSSHVIIDTEGRQVCDEVLLFAAEICAYYSDGRDGGKVPVDWCLRKFVKKPPKSPAGFVTYSEYKTLLVTPDAHREAQAHEVEE